MNVILEFQATQEYLGQAKHLAHLPAQWSHYLGWDTNRNGAAGISLGMLTSGRYQNRDEKSRNFCGMAAVSNFGDDATWAGHPMSAANTYGFGRLAWDPALKPEAVTR